MKIGHCYRSRASHQDNDIDSAVECYKAVVENEPDNKDAKLALAEIYEMLGQKAEALLLVEEGSNTILIEVDD